MTIGDAIDVLTKELMVDEEYRRSWQANIAVAFQDEFSRYSEKYKDPAEHIHEISNKAATYFLSLLCTGGEGRNFRMLPNLYEINPVPMSRIAKDGK